MIPCTCVIVCMSARKKAPVNLLMCPFELSLARVTPVWKNRGLVTALHDTSSDGMQLAGVVGRAAVAKCKQ